MEYALKNAKFIFRKGEPCYKEVLEDFLNAEYINVLTFNISEKNMRNELLDKLKEAGKREIPIRFVTNIPNRWENYWRDFYRERARNTINVYLGKLNPDNFGEDSEIFFEFDNHAKIVMTNNIIYWGSSNYSDESKDNYECGTLSKDTDFIKFVHEKVFPSIISTAVSYYEDKIIHYITTIKNGIAYLENVSMEIYDASFGVYEDYGTNFKSLEFYDVLNNSISWKQLENLKDTTNGFEKVLKNLPEKIIDDEYEETHYEEYIEIEELFERHFHEIKDLNYSIENLCYDLEEMAKYNVDTEANRILSDKYGNVAYDEALDYYMDLAYEEAKLKKDELVSVSEDTIKELIGKLDEYGKELRELTNDIIYASKKFPTKTVNPVIDNTKVQK